MEPNVAVIGAGSWGTAVASLMANNAPTMLWARSNELANSINVTQRNDRYLPGVALTKSLRATSDLSEALGEASIVLVAVPSHGAREVLSDAQSFVNNGVGLFSLIKGVEEGSLLTMSQIFAELIPQATPGVITGPNLAQEIAHGNPAACVVACEDNAIALSVQGVLHTSTFRAYTSNDVIGCEIAGVIKNVIALAAGIVDGMGMGENARAALIARGLAEMTRLTVTLGGQASTIGGLAGVGDLIVTCTSEKSRNRHVGVGLGQGTSLDEIMASMHMVAEGVKSAGPLSHLSREVGVELPICEQVASIIAGETTPVQALSTLMDRPRGAE